jgi:hypothetical protein
VTDAWTDNEHAELSRALRERDQLHDVVSGLKLELEAARLRTRHHVTVTCDRCRASLALVSSLSMEDRVHSDMLREAALGAGWTISAPTMLGLGVLVPPDAGGRDLCPACDSLT